MQKTAKDLCPCGSARMYDSCCGSYISGELIPPTAEALMRSRYTAYTQANITYIQATMREEAAENFDPIGAEQWARAAKWKWLRVVRTFPHASDEQYYYVEFIAYYILQGQPQKITEISEFKRIAGRWYYTRRVEC